MTHEELLADLNKRKALVVHCSRPGKGNEDVNTSLFPDDMLNAIELCDTGNKELCCSVIWPDHVKTFGDIGIVLKPRSIKSITLICTTDGGTHVDAETGRRVGNGVPFSAQAIAETFANPKDYNEWNIDDADTIAIFVVSREHEPEVASRQLLSEIPGYDPSMGDETLIGSRRVQLAELRNFFPHLPVLTIENGEIVDLNGKLCSPYA